MNEENSSEWDFLLETSNKLYEDIIRHVEAQKN